MKLKRFCSLLLVAALLLAVCALPAGAADITSSRMAELLHGQWRGSFYLSLTPRTYANDVAVINFLHSGDGDKFYLRVDSSDANYVTLKKWKIEGDTLTFSFNQKPWEAKVTLSYQDANTLSGTYTQYGTDHPVTMKRVSRTPVDLGQSPQYSYESEKTSYQDWYKSLVDYQTYASGGAAIPFTYELDNRAPFKKLIKDTGLDERMAECETDAQRLYTLLDTVSTNFRHRGDSGMPENQDVTSVMNYCARQNGIECRGLSIILADLCRAYGIPAKSIKCSSADVYSNYCHVVVHAYAQDLNQWIMLDPTYRLMLQDGDGNYLSLPGLRDTLIKGGTLSPNETAGRNHFPFYPEFYRAYMTKNTFHFSSATNFSFGTDGLKDNPTYTLTPLGYSYSYAYSRGETPTHDAAAFWQLPTLPPKTES